MEMNEVYLQQNLSMKNIFSLLKFADSLSVQEAKDICFEFALTNSDFFTSSSAENLGAYFMDLLVHSNLTNTF